jgi:TonB-dependent receptor
MLHRRIRRAGGVSVIALSAALGMAAGSAAAQTTPAQAGAQDVDEVIVVGTRASLQSAIQRKKNAQTTVDSIVADDIASFPDKNIGEALQRVTGVQLTRDFGEGTRVSIRGVEPDLNRVEMNGVSILGQDGLGSRGADFRELASELVKSIDVFKGFTADMTEGGVGGTVSIETRKPLELRDPFVALTLSGQYLDTTETFQPRGNITAARKFLDDRLGVIVNVTYDRNDTRGDFIRNTEWVRFFGNSTETDLNNDNRKITSNPNFASITTPQGCDAIPTSVTAVGQARSDCLQQFAEYVPRIPRYGLWIREDERISGMATVQYRVSDDLDVYVEYNQNRRNNLLTDYNYSIDVTAAARIDTSGNCATCTFDAEGNLIGFHTAPTALSATTGAGSIFSTSKREFGYVQDSSYLSGGFNWERGNFRLQGLAVTSDGTTVSDSQNIGLNASIPRVRVDLDPSSGNPTFTFPANADPNNLATYTTPTTPVPGAPTVLFYQWRPEEVDVTEDQYKLDADWDVDLPFLKRVEFGAQYRESSSLRYAGGTNFVNDQGVFVPTPFVTANVSLGAANTELAFPAGAAQGTSQTFTLAKFQEFLNQATERTPGSFFDHDQRPDGLATSWLSPNYNNFASFFDTQYINHDRVRSVNGVAQTPAHQIDEKITAAYLKGNFAFELAGMPVSGNVGVRYVKTEDISTGSNTRRETRPSPTGGANTTVTVSASTISFQDEYVDWLPSINLALEIVPNELIARFGAAKVLARPKPTDLVPNVNCLYDLTPSGISDDVNNGCTAGNPFLEPYRADQYDLNLGWYPNPDTLLNVALFYKNIETFVVTGQRTFDVNLFGDGQLFDITQPINGAGAKIKGVEVSAQTAFTFLPAPFDGFGVMANYTYSEADEVGLTSTLSGEELPFPGLSSNSYNLVAYYDKGPINARVAWNARTKYLQTPNDRTGNPVFRDGSAYLDAKLTYKLERFGDMSVFVEGKNLTGETERTTAGGLRMNELSWPGKRYFVGIAYKF